jgi:hypothetical protein
LGFFQDPFLHRVRDGGFVVIRHRRMGVTANPDDGQIQVAGGPAKGGE